MLDLYACVECGRCTDVCPASGTGKMLSPMDLMIKIRDHLTEKGAAVTGKSPWVPAFAFSNNEGNQLAGSAGNEAAATMESVSLIGDIKIGRASCRDREEIWVCVGDGAEKQKEARVALRRK